MSVPTAIRARAGGGLSRVEWKGEAQLWHPAIYRATAVVPSSFLE